MIRITSTKPDLHWWHCTEHPATTGDSGTLDDVVREAVEHATAAHTADTRKVMVSMELRQLAELRDDMLNLRMNLDSELS